MSAPKKNLNKEIIALFSGQSSTFTTPKLYVQLTGSQSLGLILNQIIFYSNKSTTCKDGWFHKDYEEWFEEILIPERTLRRKFFKLEEKNLIETKIKKVSGLNTLHVRPNMDHIIELISIMLDTDCPNRPLWPNGLTDVQKTCTKVAPTGHFGRSEPATLAVSEGSISLYTDDYLHKKLTNCESSSSFIFSETLDRDMVFQKLERDKRTPKEFLLDIKDHVENHSDKKFPKIQRAQAAIKLLKKLKYENVIFCVAGKSSPGNQTQLNKIETPEEKVERYRREREENMKAH